MKMNIQIAIVALAACTWANAQVVPDATGPGGPLVNGNLNYSFRYSQTTFLYGANQALAGNQVASVASATVNYAHPNLRFPFTLNYGGGYMWSMAGQSLGTGVFQHLFVSQGLIQRRWNLMASDGVSYTPEAPISGFSGIPGTGEPISGTGASTPSNQSILTVNTRSLSNLAAVQLGYSLDYKTTLNVSGGSQLLEYPEGNGLDTTGQDATAGIARRFNARNSISAEYLYSHFSYGASPYSDGISGSFDTGAVSFDYQRAWSRRFTTDLAAGPQWTSGSDSALVPPTKALTVNAGAGYQFRYDSANVRYNRGITGGGGYVPGAIVDSVSGGYTREFGRNLALGAMGSYFRTVALASGSGATNTRFGGAQITQRLGPYLGVFAGYTAIDQSSGLSPLTPQANVLNQFYQVINFGITYSPRQERLRR